MDKRTFKIKQGITTDSPTMVRLSQNQQDKVRQLAFSNNLTISNIIRQMVDYCLNNLEEFK